ncbi:MAG: thiol-activated cytolysin family protein [Bacteroidota bacterium]
MQFISAIKISLLCLALGLFSLACKQDQIIPTPGGPCDPTSFDKVVDCAGVPETVMDNEQITTTAEDVSTIINGEEWKCTTQEYDLVKGNPEFPLFNTNASVIYPGSLLQGASLDKATPDPIVVNRAKGTISYDLNNANGQPFVEVDEVTKGKVAGAMNTIIANSPDAFPANIQLHVQKIQSREQLALEMGVDVSTRFVEVESDLSFSTDKSYTRFLVKLSQSYYTMSFDLPTSLDAIFAPDVTPEDLARFTGAGNPATFISDVTYGRIFYMLFESTETTTKMEASINVAFNGLVNKGSGNLDVKAVEDLNDIRVKMVAFGGDAKGSFQLLGTTDLNTLADQLGNTTDIKAGLPISYVVRSVAQPDQIVKVKLATKYSVTDCVPASPGRFEFMPTLTKSLNINPNYESLIGDVDGDGKEDVILNHHIGPNNQIQVALAEGDGTFRFLSKQDHPAGAPKAYSWTDYGVQLGDVNGDGRSDLVWNSMIASSVDITDNVTYVALGQTDGSFSFVDSVMHISSTWRRNYRSYLLDYDGDGADEMVFNEVSTSRNRVYTSQADAQGNFSFNTGYKDYNLSYTSYQTLIGDVNGDGREDLIWEMTGSTERVTFGRADPNNPGKFLKGGEFFFGYGYPNYLPHVADVNGDGKDDLLLEDTHPSRENEAIWIGFSNGTKVNNQGLSNDHNVWESGSKRRLHALMGDINIDGRQDLIYNDKHGLTNVLHVGLAKANQTYEDIFSWAVAKQEHPNQGVNWDQYNEAALIDVNGDGKKDIIWISESQQIKISVALAY